MKARIYLFALFFLAFGSCKKKTNSDVVQPSLSLKLDSLNGFSNTRNNRFLDVQFHEVGNAKRIQSILHSQYGSWYPGLLYKYEYPVPKAIRPAKIKVYDLNYDSMLISELVLEFGPTFKGEKIYSIAVRDMGLANDSIGFYAKSYFKYSQLGEPRRMEVWAGTNTLQEEYQVGEVIFTSNGGEIIKAETYLDFISVLYLSLGVEPILPYTPELDSYTMLEYDQNINPLQDHFIFLVERSNLDYFFFNFSMLHDHNLIKASQFLPNDFEIGSEHQGVFSDDSLRPLIITREFSDTIAFSYTVSY